MRKEDTGVGSGSGKVSGLTPDAKPAKSGKPKAQKRGPAVSGQATGRKSAKAVDAQSDQGKDQSHLNNPSRAKKTHNVSLGKRGEDAAVAFLEKREFQILERNWKCPAGEADIIALSDEALHFIEVKTRSSAGKGFPFEAVDRAKRKRYESIAEYYLRTYDGCETAVTFDIVSILVTGPDRAFLQLARNVLSMDLR